MPAEEIVIPISLFATIFGIYYIRSRENMAMIERGLNPRNNMAWFRPFTVLKAGLLLMGVGLGAVVAMILLQYLPERTYYHDGQQYSDRLDELYPALMAVFGGLGLFLSYHLERKEARRVLAAEKEEQKKGDA